MQSSFLWRAAVTTASVFGCALPFVAAAAPSIGSVTPATATSNTPVTLTASVSSGAAISVCRLYVDLEDVGEMMVSGGVASRSYTFLSGGSRIAFVFCRDASGGMAAGPNTALWVEGAIVNSPPLPSSGGAGSPQPAQPQPQPVQPIVVAPPAPVPAAARRLYKLVCPVSADTDHPCKAVYYIGADGKRHAFSSSRVYFTWYQNFDAVEEVNGQTLSAFPLGRNVSYRPGARLVKFTSLNNVYAVGRGGVLRWIKTEAVARALYGIDWNTKVDDIPDAFFSDYSYGTDINIDGDYNVTTELTQNASFD